MHGRFFYFSNVKKADKYLIIAAAGKSSRLGGDIPKQFLKINQKEIIFYTIDRFLDLISPENIIVVLSADKIDLFKTLCSDSEVYSQIKTCPGGPERFHSIKNALKLIPDNSIVAIHDAARPMVSIKTIENCFATAQIKGNAIPVISIKSSLRKVSGALNKSVNRNNFKEVQTPQTFLSNKIKKAYNVNYINSFTDDASVLEAEGEEIFLCSGNEMNKKITTSSDLEYFRFILNEHGPSNYI